MRNVRALVAEAARRSRRETSSITLVAACKSQSPETIRAAYAAGVTDFGDNYAQELLEHHAAAPDARWHFIGHLQRNKVKTILPHASLIHSVDSKDLALEIDKRAAALGKIQPLLIEINLAAEASKTGVSAEEAISLVQTMKDLPHVTLQGLMTMPPPSENAEAGRPYFRALREIRDAWNAKSLYKAPLTDLSMGMTHDFTVAIEEGATLVRIGTGLFGARDKK